MENIIIQKNTLVKIDGIPFTLIKDTEVKGNTKNLELVRSHKSFGVPSVLKDAQSVTSEIMKPSSESRNFLK